MAAMMTAAAPTTAALAGGLSAVTPAAVMQPPALGPPLSRHAAAAARQSSTPASAPTLSSRPLAKPSGMGSMLGGSAIRRPATSQGSMEGMLGAGGGARQLGAGQLPPSISAVAAAAAAGERVDRLRASFTLPFVAAAAAAAASQEEDLSGREADQEEEEGLQGRTQASGMGRAKVCGGEGGR